MDREKIRQELQDSLDKGKTQEERNKLGQFSTPYQLALDIVKHIEQYISPEFISLLEPAVGLGVFYSAFRNLFKNSPHRASGFEIDPCYGNPARSFWKGTPLTIEISNFFDQPIPDQKYTLLLSNPPYTRHHHIPAEEKRKLQKKVWDQTGIKISGLAGLYCYFLILSAQWLQEGALSCWLIPSEFMDVKYGESVKKFLLEKVDLIHIHRFCPEDVQFSDASITSSVVIFKNQSPNTQNPIFLSQGEKLNHPKVQLLIDRKNLSPNLKWSLMFEKKTSPKKNKAISLGDIFTIKRGIATGNNDYFILNKEKINDYGIPQDCLYPILPPPRNLRNEIIYRAANGCPDINDPQFLFTCKRSENDMIQNYPRMWDYIQEGKKLGIHKGYLCSHRSPWYFCEKRQPAPFLIPYMGRKNKQKRTFRFILNYSEAITTNVYLMLYPKIELKNKMDETLLLKIWNILNAIPQDIFLEGGRVYGGGLYKLEPYELMNISIPNEEIQDYFVTAPSLQQTFF